jgi:transposase
VPGLGKVTSAALIAAMPELGQVSNNIATALLGVAPYDDDSGRRRCRRPRTRRPACATSP